MGGRTPGELEHLVLATVARLGAEAYGVAVHEELVRLTGRDLTVPAIYITLGRLERKGWLDSASGRATAERGGRAKRFFALTGAGARVLAEAREALDRVWAGVDLEPYLGRIR